MSEISEIPKDSGTRKVEPLVFERLFKDKDKTAQN